jgi:hypothetical protein
VTRTPFPATITTDDIRPFILEAGGRITFLDELPADDRDRIAGMVYDCDTEGYEGPIATWDTHTAQLSRLAVIHALAVETHTHRGTGGLNVADRIAEFRRSPEVDWTAVERYLNGPERFTLTPQERLEAFRYLVQARRMGRRDVMERLHISGQTYNRLVGQLRTAAAAA